MSPPSSAEKSNARLGLQLFAIYLLLYLGFVLLSAFAAGLMERPVIAGLNLAIVYGFALIISALVMALIYGYMCRAEPNADDVAGSVGTSDDARGDHGADHE